MQKGIFAKRKTIMEEMYMNDRQKPVHEIRKGDVRATIWFNQNPGRRGWYSVTISRVYSRGYQLQYASSFRYDDLMDIRKVARRAHFWIWWQGGSLSRKRR